SGGKRQSFRASHRFINSVGFSTTGSALITSQGNTIRLWEVASGKELLPFAADQGPVKALAYLEGGKILASGSEDGTRRLWDYAEGKNDRTLKGHPQPIRIMAFCPIGNILAAASDEGMIVCWELGTGKKVCCINVGQDRLRSLSFSPNTVRL